MVQESARLGTTQPCFETAAETMERLDRLEISTTTLWRHHKEVAKKMESELEREEREVPAWVLWGEAEAMDWIEAQDPIQDHASISIDGTTIRVRHEGYKEVKIVSVSEAEALPKKKREPEAGEGEREGPEEISGVQEKDGRGRQDELKLTRHSYRAVLGDKATFAPALKAELARRRVKNVDKITTVNDGADWIWSLVQDFLPERRVEVLDWSHAVENLSKAAKAAFGEGTPKAQAWLDQRKTELWDGRVKEMRTALVQLPRRYKKRGDQIRQVRGYMTNHSERLAYDRFRAEGRPIGSGTVESGAKNLVQWRMKRGGQSWSPPGAMRMLAALGEVHSNRWDLWGYQRRRSGTGQTQIVYARARRQRSNSKELQLAAA